MDSGRKEIHVEVKKLIIKWHFKGKTSREIADLLDSTNSTISRIIKRYKSAGSLENLKRSGRLRIFDHRDVRKLRRILSNNRRMIMNRVVQEFNICRAIEASTSTIKRYIYELGFRKRSLRKSLILRKPNIKKRISWARLREKWTVDSDWHKHIFSDECSVVVGHDSRIKVWRTLDERDKPWLYCRKSQRKISVMIWGCLTYQGIGTLALVKGHITGQKYISIIQDHLWPVIAKHHIDLNCIYVDDNAPVHRAGIVTEYLRSEGIPVSEWAPQSPDMNIIENVWYYLKKELSKRTAPIRNETELFNLCKSIWDSIPTGFVKSLYSTLPTRIKEVIKMKGQITKY